MMVGLSVGRLRLGFSGAASPGLGGVATSLTAGVFHDSSSCAMLACSGFWPVVVAAMAVARSYSKLCDLSGRYMSADVSVDIELASV